MKKNIKAKNRIREMHHIDSERYVMSEMFVMFVRFISSYFKCIRLYKIISKNFRVLEKEITNIKSILNDFIIAICNVQCAISSK
jgi:hypothetical protein